MAAVKLSDEVKLDAPAPSTATQIPAESGGAKQVPHDIKLDSLESLDQTSAGGLASSIARGLAPVATGAGVGAMLGAPFGGVGAIPGAAAGAGAMALTQLAGAVYKPFAEAFGWPKVATPQEMTDRVLDAAGVKRPSTGAERAAEAMAGGAAGAMGEAKLAGVAADKLASPLAKGIAGRLADKPGLQVAAGASGAAEGQLTAEMGGGPLAQYAASTLGSTLPYGATGLRSVVKTDPRPAALEARKAGYVLPPAAISEKPGLVSSVLAGWGGKIKTQQDASTKNQIVTNDLAAQSLGLPKGTTLTDQTFKAIRDKAGQAYAAVAQATPVIHADSAYDATVAGLGSRNGQAQQLFPKITKNPGIEELVTDLQNNKQIPTPAAIEVVKELRFNANANMKARDDPSKLALGYAQRQAADAIDSLMERNLAAVGQPDVVDSYRRARQLIAKSYDVEGATNYATGDVNARYLASLKAKGRPLTGELDTIANVATGFPKTMMPPAGFGYDESFSALDFFGSAALAAHGHAPSSSTLAAAVIGRPAVRSLLLSKPYQKAMTSQDRTPLPMPLALNPGFPAIVQPDDALKAPALSGGQASRLK